MAYGTGLSAAAASALSRQAARPSKAERMQAESISAQANAASMQREFTAQQRDRDYQRQTDQRNVERNDRANEIRQKEEYAERMMERQNEMAVEAQRKQDAFRLQTIMAKRKTNAQPGGTQQAISATAAGGAGGYAEAMAPRPQGGGTLTYSEGLGPMNRRTLEATPEGIFATSNDFAQTRTKVRGTVVTGRRNVAPLPEAPMSALDQKRHHDIRSGLEKQRAHAQYRQTNITMADKTGKGMFTEDQTSRAITQAYKEYSDLTALIERIDAQLLLTGGGPEASNAVRHVTDFAGVADEHMDEAVSHAASIGTPGDEAAIRNYLKATYGYDIR